MGEFESVISEFCTKSAFLPRANMIAVGDAPYEHDALRRVVEGSPWLWSPGSKSKSVNFIPRPTIAELKIQVQTLTRGLNELVSHYGDLNTRILEKAECL